MQQVFLNLLKNSAQAMANASAANPAITLSVHSDSRMIQIEIEDNGPGMSEDIRKRVFEPFFTTKDVGVGTGLGLSVSYFIVTENHRGTMSVESTPGTGANFIIRLPV
jgi:signal transduction histidine kinase